MDKRKKKIFTGWIGVNERIKDMFVYDCDNILDILLWRYKKDLGEIGVTQVKKVRLTIEEV